MWPMFFLPDKQITQRILFFPWLRKIFPKLHLSSGIRCPWMGIYPLTGTHTCQHVGSSVRQTPVFMWILPSDKHTCPHIDSFLRPPHMSLHLLFPQKRDIASCGLLSQTSKHVSMWTLHSDKYTYVHIDCFLTQAHISNFELFVAKWIQNNNYKPQP